MFYTLISVIVVNSYLLSSYAPVPKEKKFIEHVAFREALYKALFEHATGAAAAGAVDSLPVAGPVNLVLPPGDTVSVVAKGATVATTAVLAAVVDACVEHQRVSMKRAPCVICKQAAEEGKRGIKGTKSSVF